MYSTLRTPAVKDMHHPVTWKFLSPMSLIRHELEAFSTGDASRGQLPLLMQAVMPFMFVPIVERTGERDHSIMHKAVSGRRPGGPKSSLAIRMPEILELLKTGPGFTSLISKFELARSGADLARTLGLAMHPSIKERLLTSPKRELMLRLLSSVLYSLDPESQFLTHEKARAQHKQRKEARKKQAKLEMPQPRLRYLTKESYMLVHMIRHCRQVMKPGCYYSCPAGSVTLEGVSSSRSNLARRALTQATGLQPDSGFEVCCPCKQPDGDGDGQPQSRLTVFRLLHGAPGRAVVVPTAPAISNRIDGSALAVTTHDASTVDTAHLDVNPEPACAMATTSPVAIMSMTPA